MHPVPVVVDLLLQFNMDFQFNYLYGKVFTQCSMGYEALAQWFNIEIPLNPSFIQCIDDALTVLSSPYTKKTFSFVGKEYSLYLTQDDAIIKAHFLQEEHEIFQDDLHLYQDESFSCCGREDFAHLFYAYVNFLEEK